MFDSAGVQAPQVPAHVTGAARVRVAIATPKGTTLVRASCPGSQAEQTGLLLGVVRDVDNGAPLAGARVVSRWFELTIDRQGNRYATLETTATADRAGVFRLCGVPADIPVLVRAESGSQQSGRVERYFNGSDIAFRDFTVSLADTAARVVPDSMIATSEHSSGVTAPRGTAAIRGLVRDANGRPLGSARVGLLDRRETVATGSDGRFVLDGLPREPRQSRCARLGTRRRAERSCSARARRRTLRCRSIGWPNGSSRSASSVRRTAASSPTTGSMIGGADRSDGS